MNKAELRLEEYFQRVKPFSQEVSQVNPRSCQSKIIEACSWLEEWFVGYKGILDRYVQSLNESWQTVPLYDNNYYNLDDGDLMTSTNKGLLQSLWGGIQYTQYH